VGGGGGEGMGVDPKFLTYNRAGIFKESMGARNVLNGLYIRNNYFT
jgi:hypothetical protein